MVAEAEPGVEAEAQAVAVAVAARSAETALIWGVVIALDAGRNSYMEHNGYGVAPCGRLRAKGMMRASVTGRASDGLALAGLQAAVPETRQLSHGQRRSEEAASMDVSMSGLADR